MAETLKRKIRYGCGVFLLLLLLTWVVLPLCTGAAYAETGDQSLNSSGNRNVDPSVDPAAGSGGFSAVLYNIRNGLPTSDANAIAQTADGFLWIGSYAGLIRYDGNTFERIDSAEGLDNVCCLYVDSLDRLWIGTNDSGVFLMTEGEFRKWNEADGLASVSIRAIAEDGEGFLYAACAAGGIAVIDPEGNLTIVQDERLAGETVPEIRSGSDGLIYGFTQAGDLFTVKGSEVITFLSHGDCPIRSITCILPDPAHPGNLYVGTSMPRICYGNLEQKFTGMDVMSISPLAHVNRLEVIGGKILVCAGNGAGELDAGEFHLLQDLPMNNSVSHVMTDYEGNLWFTSGRQGVMKIVPNQFTDLNDLYDLPAAVVNSTCLLDGDLFIGTDDGLTVVRDGEKASSIPLKSAVTASGEDLGASDLLEFLDGVRIRSIIRDSKGRLWISTWRKYGLLCYDQGGLTAFTPEDGLFSDMPRVVAELEDGSVAAANYGGVSIIQNGAVTASWGVENGIANPEILTVAEGFHNDLILGSDGGGIYLVGPDGTRHIGREDGLRSEIVMRVKRSSSRELCWIVTGNSLAYMTPDYHVTTIQNFPYPNNFDLFESENGDVWVLSSTGIFVVPAEELLADGPIDPVFFGVNSGVPYIATANSFSELTAGGDLYIAGTEGVALVNLEKPFENIGTLKIALPYVDADGERFYPDGSGSFTVPYNTKKLTVYPYVFSYSLVDPRVSYRLEGFDEKDTTISRSRLIPVDYTNLKNGAYLFSMTVKDPVGHSARSVSFRIVQGKEMPAGTAGTVILDIASLFLMGGILFYTSLYRKRGRLEDRLFVGLILSNMALTVGELASYLLEYGTRPFVRDLMILGNTLFYAALVFFPYLVFVYYDYRSDQNMSRVRKNKLLAGIPCFLFLAVMLFNLKTGWIFSITEGNAFRSGAYDDWIFALILFYFLLSGIRLYKESIRLVLLFVLLVLTRIAWEFWVQEISATSFIYTLFLECIHVNVMNRPIYEEAL